MSQPIVSLRPLTRTDVAATNSITGSLMVWNGAPSPVARLVAVNVPTWDNVRRPRDVGRIAFCQRDLI